MKILYVIVFVLTLGACTPTSRSMEKVKSDQSTTTEVTTDSVLSYVNEWKSDTCGCSNKRTIELAIKIIEDNDLMGKPLDTVVKYLGTYFTGDIGYYNKCFCYGDTPIIGARRTSMLRFENGKLVSDGFIYTRQE